MMIRTAPIDLAAVYRRLLTQFHEGMNMTPEQLQRFAEVSAPERLRHFALTAVGSLFFFNLFLASDRYMLPDVFDLAITLRLCVVTPALLALALVIHFSRDWWLRRVPPQATEVVAMVGTMVITGTLGILMYSSHSDQVAVYRGGLVPILVFGNLVQQLRFRYALVSTLFNLAVYVGTLLTATGRASPYAITDVPLLLLMLLVAVYTLMSNFNLEMDERQSFLQQERARTLRDELEGKHDELRAMSRLDPLTGLPNRRQFDEFVEQWAHSNPAASSLSVVLIDVDHFKAFNDRYGHPAGDQCLKLVAAALQYVMFSHEGLAARWGGEEFAVVLPGTDADQGRAVGELICRRVEELAMRHEASPTSRHVTASCGVASGLVRGVQDADRLMQRADGALYQAKAAGRNRCIMG